MAIIYLDGMSLSSAWPTGNPLLVLVIIVIVAYKDYGNYLHCFIYGLIPLNVE